MCSVITQIALWPVHPVQVIINCEWGAFGDNGCLEFMRTEVDQEVDRSSVSPGEHVYDLSFTYLGLFITYRHVIFLADRTNGRAYATVLRLSVCRRL